MSEKRGKKRPKSYYIKCAKKPRQYGGGRLDAGMRGFLVTCNKREKEAVREMYNLLNEYADQMYGREEVRNKSEKEAVREMYNLLNEYADQMYGREEIKQPDKGDNSHSDLESEEEDLEKAMQQEISEIKETKKVERRFQNTNTKVSNCIFIRTTLPDPCELAHRIFSDLATSRQQKTRSAIRLLPIANSCKAFEKDIKKMAEEMFVKYFETPYGSGLNYTTVFKTRNNSSLSREDIIPSLGQIIKDLNPLHRVNHNTPDYVVLVEIVGNICCMSVVKDFFKFRKYNLHEVVKDRTEQVAVHSNSREQTRLSTERSSVEDHKAKDGAERLEGSEQLSKGNTECTEGSNDVIGEECENDQSVVKGVDSPKLETKEGNERDTELKTEQQEDIDGSKQKSDKIDSDEMKCDESNQAESETDTKVINCMENN